MVIWLPKGSQLTRWEPLLNHFILIFFFSHSWKHNSIYTWPTIRLGFIKCESHLIIPCGLHYTSATAHSLGLERCCIGEGWSSDPQIYVSQEVWQPPGNPALGRQWQGILQANWLVKVPNSTSSGFNWKTTVNNYSGGWWRMTLDAWGLQIPCKSHVVEHTYICTPYANTHGKSHSLGHGLVFLLSLVLPSSVILFCLIVPFLIQPQRPAPALPPVQIHSIQGRHAHFCPDLNRLALISHVSS